MSIVHAAKFSLFRGMIRPDSAVLPRGQGETNGCRTHLNIYFGTLERRWIEWLCSERMTLNSINWAANRWFGKGGLIEGLWVYLHDLYQRAILVRD
jgi:hypothetical protein